MFACSWRRVMLASAVLALLTYPAGFGQTNQRVDDRNAEAVALARVVRQGRAFHGAAFCIDKAGLFVSSADVVGLGLDGGVLGLILAPGTKEPQRVKARLVHWDEAIGLSVLKIDAARPQRCSSWRPMPRSATRCRSPPTASTGKKGSSRMSPYRP